MQAGEYQLGCATAPTCQPRPPAYGTPTPLTSLSGSAPPPDALELEALALNIDASLRVHARHQLFVWTQGLLQNLIKHELLICARRNGEPMPLHVDSFATSPIEPATFSDLFRQDTSLGPHLIKSWEDNRFLPVSCETGDRGLFEHSPLARELGRIGADVILAHGTYDVFGKLDSFFAFACRAGGIGPKQAYFAEVLVPFLHLAWVRTQVSRPAESGSASPAGAGVLTSREREILRWIHLGKTNIEIGAILGISPLTVKNHVQKILRKLNVQNRAQAVGKGMALRILNV